MCAAGSQSLAETCNIEPERGICPQSDCVARCVKVSLAERLMENGECAAQRPPCVRIVIVWPEECRERVAAMTPAGYREIGEQGTRLAGIDGERLAVTLDARRTEEKERHASHQATPVQPPSRCNLPCARDQELDAG